MFPASNHYSGKNATHIPVCVIGIISISQLPVVICTALLELAAVDFYLCHCNHAAFSHPLALFCFWV